MIDATVTRLCQHCCDVKPIAQFRRRMPGGDVRSRQCNDCHNLSERMRRSNDRSRRADRLMSQFLTNLKRQRSCRQIEILCSLVCAEFGGLEAFAAAWIDYFRRAAERGGATGLRCFQALVTLLQYLEEHRSKIDDLSDEELGDELMLAAKRLIQQQPELALEAARQLGWNVTPA